MILITIVRSSAFYSKYILRFWYLSDLRNSMDSHGSRIGTLRRTDCT